MSSKTKTSFTYSSSRGFHSGMYVTAIQTSEKTLQIPLEEEDDEDGYTKRILGLSLSPNLILSSVRTLILPEDLEDFEATQRNFPNLQRLFFQNRDFPEMLTEGMDLAIYGDYNTLLACLSSQKSFVIPDFVENLGPFAFRDSPVEEIVCKCPYLRKVDPDAFVGSAWIEKNSCLVNANAVLYLARDIEELRLLDDRRWIKKNAFAQHLPKKVYVHSLSSLPDYRGPLRGTKASFYQEVFVQDTEKFFPIARYCPTENFSLPEDDERYSCVDGVVFSKDKSELLLYPLYKPGKEYFVPEGTQSLLHEAFGGVKFLESLHLPSSVISCGDSCFQSMPSLRFCSLPDTLEVISAQLFASCRELKSFSSPKGLRSIEKNAFRETALTEITLPEGVTSVGEEAFDHCSLKKVHLPSTLQHLGTRSLYQAREVWAYEGTAKGLFGALHESQEHCFFHPVINAPASLVHVLGGEKEKILFFPTGLMELDLDIYIQDIWDGEFLDFGLLAKFFPFLSFPNKAEVALSLALQEEDPKGEYHQYLRRIAKKAGEYFLFQEVEPVFRLFAGEISLTPATRMYLLDLCNKEGRVQEAAYLLNQKGGKSSPRGMKL